MPNVIGVRGSGGVTGAGQTADVRTARKAYDDILAKGGKLEKKGDSYYLRADVQNSAGRGTQSFKVDRELAEAILKAEATGGVESKPEIINTILPRLADGGRYGVGEGILARMLLAGTDDRKSVKLNGQNINLTNPAEAELKHDLRSFWGKLGADARWGKSEVVAQDTEGVKKTVDSAVSKGGNLTQRGGKYYVSANVQNSARSGTHEYQVDAKLAKAILKAERTGGVESQKEVGKILTKIKDGGRYGEGEAVLTRMLLAATDDRKSVKLNGTNINLTNPAEAAFKHGILSFWGKLGAEARWGDPR